MSPWTSTLARWSVSWATTAPASRRSSSASPGVHHPDAGQIFFDGQEVHFSRPIEARQAGIETIYQDLALAGNLDVSANIFLGREVKKRHLGGAVKTLDEKTMRGESDAILQRLGIKIPQMRLEIEKLSGGQRQAVAIARAIYWNARLMIMDEPTNNLGVPEQRKVMSLIGTLREEGVPVILISHTLPDVFAITDRIVIMHRGRKVAEMPTSRPTRPRSSSTWSAHGSSTPRRLRQPWQPAV